MRVQEGSIRHLSRGSGPRAVWPLLTEGSSLMIDFLLICSVCYGLCAMTGMKDYPTLAALGIAIYLSSKHFGYLRREIESLRQECSALTAGPLASVASPDRATHRRRPGPLTDDIPHEGRTNWGSELSFWERDEARARVAVADRER